MKAYTDIEQSKKLAEILPIESADMFYAAGNETQPTFKLCSYGHIISNGDIPCWSLAALLDILPDKTCVYKKTYKDGRIKYHGIIEGIKELILKDNSVDACVAIIEKLHEFKML
jgi:hypothetical protein